MWNLLLNTDSYKAAHWVQYPPGTERVYCYIEARHGDRKWGKTLFFGLQAFLMEYLEGPVIQEEDIDEASKFFAHHGEPFNAKGWHYILDTYDGRLPLSIRALPEGSVLPIRNVLVTVENTDPHCWWLPAYIETALLRAVWYPTTVATRSWQARQIINTWLERTCDDPASQIDFKLHDFGARGVSSMESAALGGMAHLVNFNGTDTISGILAARRWYGADMPGVSIPATEHSTIIAWGQDREGEAYRNMLDRFGGPGKTFACVSDSYDLWHAIRDLWGGELRDRVAKSGGTLVIRPDSGNPTLVVPGALDALEATFGASYNSKGWKVLPACVRLIQGDGVDEAAIDAVLTAMAMRGWSAENVAFGMGGGLLQKLDRDTLGFAMKASEVMIDGIARPVRKTPVDAPEKASRGGRFSVELRGGAWATVAQHARPDKDLLCEVFRNGKVLRETDFDEVRARARGFDARSGQ